MALIKAKPSDLQEIWAERGDIIKPSSDKIGIGWLVEIPPREWFNWLFNNITRGLAHVNQRGIPEWDNTTQYLKGKSYVQDRDGTVYRAIQDSLGDNPSSDRVHWEVAFASISDVNSRRDFLGYTTSPASIIGQSNFRYYFTNAATLTLPDNFERGDSVVVGKSPNVEVYIQVEGSHPIHTKMGDFLRISHNIDDEIVFHCTGSGWEVS